ncbi:MAG: flavin reductase family protein [Planctomycetota bacterium]
MSGPGESRIAPHLRALGTVPSGLFIVTAGVGPTATGTLVSFVQQVGFVPPAITVALKEGRHVLDLLRDGGRFCISVIDDASVGLLRHFARGFEPGEPAFADQNVGHDEAGVPYLVDALAWLSCRVIGEVAWSDHVLVCGEVLAGERRDDDRPMVHVRKSGAGY